MITPFCILAAALIASGAPASASEFSADIVSLDSDGVATPASGRIYVSNDRVRIEAPDIADGFFIVDGSKDEAFFIRPDQKLFMNARQSSALTQILVPLDPEDPCPKWRAMAASAGMLEHDSQWRCDRIGEEKILGRATVAYSVASSVRAQRIVWIDPEIKFAIKGLTQDAGGVHIDNMQEGPQPASLFEIPADYRKFDPQRLIEIIKKSDVWVEPVK